MLSTLTQNAGKTSAPRQNKVSEAWVAGRLADLFPFSRLGPPERQLLARRLRLHRLPAETPFFPDCEHTAYLLGLDGFLQLLKEHDGQGPGLMLPLPPGLLWPLPATGKGAVAPGPVITMVTVIGDEEGVVGLLSEQAVATLCRHSAPLRLALVRSIALSSGHMTRELLQRAGLPLATRLARLLLERARQDEARLVVPFKHRHLAAWLGTYRETVTTLLGQFQAAGWVKVHFGAVEILNMPALQAAANAY